MNRQRDRAVSGFTIEALGASVSEKKTKKQTRILPIIIIEAENFVAHIYVDFGLATAVWLVTPTIIQFTDF